MRNVEMACAIACVCLELNVLLVMLHIGALIIQLPNRFDLSHNVKII